VEEELHLQVKNRDRGQLGCLVGKEGCGFKRQTHLSFSLELPLAGTRLCNCLFVFFETVSHYVAQAGFEFMILLECWDCTTTPGLG
jgi:hypothetical protein